MQIINWNYSIFGSVDFPRLGLSMKKYLYPITFVFFSNSSFSGLKDAYESYVNESGGSNIVEVGPVNVIESEPRRKFFFRKN